ncbi:hypothetical protein ELY33_00615 [Vreelandella andesensis]|uniref:Uncharacterized protein n=1 Tax=Vreelandella andesensis TaxID=447567 RepID=A0A3S0YNS4_9GAMM|nr:ESPR-type extended signal peptide-containing protein [Halomonas andesensis]RUR35019.1 hypothetical protein ELY33_00615 [Halomonas andesensis]
MNNVFRLIWNRTLGRLVVASEAARSQHKAGSCSQQVGQVPKTSGRRLLNNFFHPVTLGVALACSTMLSPLSISDAEARRFASENTTCTSGGTGGTVGNIATPNTDSDPIDGSGSYSTVAGCNASGNSQTGATVYGTFSEVTGKGGAAFGFNARAAQWATAIGLESRATGEASTALGFGSKATKASSVAIGAQSETIAENGIAIGGDATAGGSGIFGLIRKDTNGVLEATIKDVPNPAMAIGGGSNAFDGAIALGPNSNASAINSMAFGGQSVASDFAALAFGPAAYATGLRSTAIGYQSAAAATYSMAFGPASTATGEYSLAFGASASASGKGALAIGSYSSNGQELIKNTQATGDDSVAFGTSAQATANNAIAVGLKSTASLEGDIAIGANAFSKGVTSAAPANTDLRTGVESTAYPDGARLSSVVVGDGASAYYGTAIGMDAVAGKEVSPGVVRSGTAVGGAAQATGNFSIAISPSQYSPAVSTGDNAISIGRASLAEGNASTAIGTLATSSAIGATALGLRAEATDEYALAAGGDAEATNKNAIAVGSGAKASGKDSLAMGTVAKASGEQSISIGYRNDVSGDHSGAFGDPNNITGAGSYALGNDNTIAADNAGAFGNDNKIALGADGTRIMGNGNNIDVADALVIGNNADVTEVGGVALGSGSVADTASGVAGYVPTSSTAVDKLNIENTVATRAAVDVGSRQITSVAAGTELNDAVNVSQLIAVENMPLTFAGDNAGNEFERKLGEQINVTGGATGTLTDNNIGVVANGTDTLAIKLAKDVNLGTDGSLTIAGGPSISNTGINMGGVDTNGKPTNKITNLAPGTADTDAVNVEQLIAEKTRYYSWNDNGLVQGNYNNDNAVGVNSLAAGIAASATEENATAIGTSAVASGTGSAAIGYKANAQGANSFALGETSNAIGENSLALGADSTAGTRYTTALGRGTLATGQGAIALGGGTATDAASATGTGAIAIGGYGANTSGGAKANVNYSVALGSGAQASASEGDVALGSGSKTATANPVTSATVGGTTYGGFAGTAPTSVVSVGSVGAERQITNVAAGRITNTSTDAINGSQLFSVVESVVDTGFNLSADNGADDTVKLGETVNYTNTDGNLLATVNNNEIVYDLAANINVDSVTAGNSTLDTNGLTVDDGAGNLTSVTNDGLIVAGGPSMTTSGGIDANNQKISNVAPGEVSATSTDGINGGQLFGSVDAINTVIGGNATVNPDGTITTSDIGGTGEDTINDAIASANTAANAGWNLTGSGADQVNIGPNGAVDFQGDANISVAQSGADDNGVIDITLNRDLDVDSVTAGNSTLDTNGLTVDDGAGNLTRVTNDGLTVAGGPSMTASGGIDANNQKISNVAPGEVSATSTDGINGSQLFGSVDSINTVIGGNSVVNPDGTITTSDIGGTGEDTINDAIASANTAANAGWNVFTTQQTGLNSSNVGPSGKVDFISGDNNLAISHRRNDAGDTTLDYRLADNVTINESLTVGPVSIGATGFDAGKTTISGVADGQAPQDAVNLSQLQNSAAASKTEVAAGTNVASVDKTTGANGQDIYTVNAQGASVKAGTGVDVAAATDANNVTDYEVALNQQTQDSLTLADSALQTLTSDDPNLVVGDKDDAGNIVLNFADAPTFIGTVTAPTFVASGANPVTVSGETGTITGLTNTSLDADGFGKLGRAATEEQLKSVGETANAGWNLSTQDASAQNITPNGEVNLRNTDENLEITQVTKQGREEVTFNLADDVRINNSISVGDNVTLGDTGLVIADGPSVTRSGIDAGSQQITNVASGLGDMPIEELEGDALSNAINAGDLQNVAKDLGTSVAAAKTEVEAGSNMSVVESISDDGQTVYTVATADEVSFERLDVGSASIDVGNVDSNGNTRISGVGEGDVNEGSTDAINGAQLWAAQDLINNLEGDITNIAGDTGDEYITNNGRGIRYVRTNESGLALSDAFAEAQGSTAIGYQARATADRALAMGYGAVASHQGSVALGEGARTDKTESTVSVEIAGQTYQFAGTSPVSTVSVGNVGAERTITNVAAGRISATSTDAINGSQLYAANQFMESLDTRLTSVEGGLGSLTETVAVTPPGGGEGAVEYARNDDGSTNNNTVELAGEGGTKITNMAPGDIAAGSSDAVSGDQLYTAQQEVAGNTSNIEGNRHQIAGNTNSISNINTALDKGLNVSADQGEPVNRKLGDTVAVTGDDNITTRTTNQGVQVTLNRELNVNSVTTGNTSVSNEGVRIQGGPSMTVDGFDANGTTITNVAPGINAGDAVNVGQMNELGLRFANEINNVHGRIDKVERNANAGIAAVAAMGHAPYVPGKLTYHVGGGYHGGESAIGINFRRTADNGRWSLNAGVAGSHAGATIGVGISGVID